MAEVDPDVVDRMTDDRSPSPAVDIIPIITSLAKSYTRGRGFDDDVPNGELAAVITTAAARLAVNGSGIGFRKKVDEVEEEWRTGFTGWTLAELTVLNRYRVTAM